MKSYLNGDIRGETAFEYKLTSPLDVRIAGKQFVAERQSILDWRGMSAIAETVIRIPENRSPARLQIPEV